MNTREDMLTYTLKGNLGSEVRVILKVTLPVSAMLEKSYDSGGEQGEEEGCIRKAC